MILHALCTATSIHINMFSKTNNLFYFARPSYLFKNILWIISYFYQMHLFLVFWKKAQFEITILTHVLNADNPLYRLFRETLYPCLHHLFIK